MGPPGRKTCCICGVKSLNNKSKKQLATTWRTSTSYERDFECCFGPAAEGRSGDICQSCKNKVLRYRKNKEEAFPHVLDCNLNTRNDSDRGSYRKPLSTINIRPSLPPVPTPETSVSLHSTTSNSAEPALLNNVLSPPIEPSLGISELSHSQGCPESPTRKRIRDDAEVVVRVSRQKKSGIVSNCSRTWKVTEPGPQVLFLGRMVPISVAEHILSYLSQADLIQLTLGILVQLQNANKTNEEMQVKMNRMQFNLEKYESLKNVREKGPLTQPQKTILHKLVINRENNEDEDGCIVIPHMGSGGKAKQYFKLPKIEKNSKDAGKRTLNKRSKIYEKLEKILASGRFGDGIHQQRVNNIARDRTGYSAAAEEAGLKVVAQFSRENVLKLRSIMTLRMWRVLKRLFTDEVGWDVFGSVEKLTKELKQIEFQYDCGTVTSSTGNVVHFVRVLDVKEVVSSMVNELRKANELIYLDNLEPDHLWLHAAADKGGKSSKLILQVINQKRRHSMDVAKLIGYFEGKDNRANLEAVFGPILRDLQECAANISELYLERPTQPPSLDKKHHDHHNSDGKLLNALFCFVLIKIFLFKRTSSSSLVCFTFQSLVDCNGLLDRLGLILGSVGLRL